MQWLRLYHDTPNDPKWRLVAAESGQSEAIVLAVWIHMMVNASRSKTRGTLEGWDDRIIAASMGLRGEVVASVRAAMQGVVLEGDRLTGWEKRQRSSDSAAERMRKSRAAKAASPDGDGGGGGGNTNRQNEAEPTPKPNGADHRYRNGSVTQSSRHVTEHSMDVTEHSEDVLEHSLTRKTPDSEREDSKPTLSPHVDSSPPRVSARAREVGGRIAAMTGLEVTDRNLQTVEGWLARGADPVEDILPAVAEKLATMNIPLRQVEYFGFFSGLVLRFRQSRTNPQPERPRLTVVQSGGRPIPKAVLDLRELKQRYTGSRS